jgi:hypothetical protein
LYNEGSTTGDYMTEGKSKAYRLAEELEQTPFESTRHEAAAELRRLHDETQYMNQAGIQQSGEVIFLEKQNAELLRLLGVALPMVAVAYDKGFVDAEAIGRDIEEALASAKGAQP